MMSSQHMLSRRPGHLVFSRSTVAAGALVMILVLCAEAVSQTWTWQWSRKVGTSGFNDSFCSNPLNPDILYASPGNNTIVISRDRGHTWQNLATVGGGNQIKAIFVSKRDTSSMLVAQEAGPPDRVMKTTNGGITWFQTLAGNFYYWGHPLAYEPSLNDETVYTEASNILYRSQDFGSTWDTVRVNPFGSNNQGWEDALIRPDSSNVLFVADNANGIWKTNNRGVTWRRVYTASGEVPAIALNMKNPAIIYAAKWGGGGGFLKSSDFGETWQSISLFNGKNMWGVAVSTEFPDYVVTGTWGHSYSSDGGIYISRDAGQTWERTFQGLSSTSNHALFVLDTLAVFALQGDGIWKLRFPGTVAGSLYMDVNANGVRDSLEPGIAGRRVRISGSRVDSMLTGSSGEYRFSMLGPGNYSVHVPYNFPWVITQPGSGSYAVTVTDGEQHTKSDFGLITRSMSVVAPNGGERWVIADTHQIQWTGVLTGNTVTIGLSRNGGLTYDTLLAGTPNDGVEAWRVTGPATSQARIRVSSDAYPTLADTSDSNFTIAEVSGLASSTDLPDSYRLFQNHPNPFNPITTITFGIPSASIVKLKVFDLLGREVGTLVDEHKQPGTYTVIWDASQHASGIYFYRLHTGVTMQTKKMVLLR